MEVMLSEADRVIAEIVGEARLRGNLAQHLVIQIAAQPNHPLLDLGLVADRWKIKKRYFHSCLDFSRTRLRPLEDGSARAPSGSRSYCKTPWKRRANRNFAPGIGRRTCRRAASKISSGFGLAWREGRVGHDRETDDLLQPPASARIAPASFSTRVPLKKSGFIPPQNLTGLVNTNSRKFCSVINPSSANSCASGSTSRMSGTSKWPMSEPKSVLSLAPYGLTRSSKPHTFIGSSASQPKCRFLQKRSRMSSARSIPHAAKSS